MTPKMKRKLQRALDKTNDSCASLELAREVLKKLLGDGVDLESLTEDCPALLNAANAATDAREDLDDALSAATTARDAGLQAEEAAWDYYNQNCPS